MSEHESDKQNSSKAVVVEIDRGSQAPSRAIAGERRKRRSAVQKTAPIDAMARLQAEKDELMQTMVRRQADFENYRKRIERERDEERRRGIERLLEDLLPVLDAFERALRAHDNPAYEEYRKGLELIYRQLWDTLARHGLERIAAADKPFDPHFHQAIERVETHGASRRHDRRSVAGWISCFTGGSCGRASCGSPLAAGQAQAGEHGRLSIGEQSCTERNHSTQISTEAVSRARCHHRPSVITTKF